MNFGTDLDSSKMGVDGHLASNVVMIGFEEHQVFSINATTMVNNVNSSCNDNKMFSYDVINTSSRSSDTVGRRLLTSQYY